MRLSGLLVVVLAAGCDAGGGGGSPAADAGVDARLVEAGVDGARPDGALLDAGSMDAEPLDARTPDLGVDAALPDAAAVDAAPPENPIQINEVDCTGERWFELRNGGAEGLEIADWVVGFGDRRWTIPLGYYLGPRAFLAFPGPREMAELTTFELACGEPVRLWAPDGTLVDEVVPEGVRPNGTWGRLPDGGAWQATGYTRGAPNTAPLPPDAVLFDAGHVPTLAITITPENRALLDMAPRVPVPARITLTLPDEAEAEPAIEGNVSLAGAPGAFRSLAGKANLLLDLPEPGLFGVTRLELDARLADRAMLSRWLALEFYRRAGAPSPRAGLAWVRVDLGEGPRDFGLYLTVETLDAAAAERAFGPTAQVLAIGSGFDLVRGMEQATRVLVGDLNDFEPLRRLVSLVERIRPASLRMLTADRIDWEGALKLFAAEAVGDLRDGYFNERYDWALQLDPAGNARLLGNRAERALVGPGSLHQGSGSLFRACLTDPACQADYDRAVGDFLAALSQDSLAARLRSLRTSMAPWVQRDPRRPYSAQAVADGIEALAVAVEARVADAQARMACRLGDDADADGDGFLCEDDCAPEDPLRNPAAEDVCGNRVDEDCSGVADDTVGCADCVERRRGTRTYLLCTTPRDFEHGVEQCAALGAVAVKIDAEGEAVWLDSAMRAAGFEAYWVGLSDRFGGGLFTWTWDGLEAAVARWAMDEPAAFAGGRCARADVAGTWTAVPCDAALPIVCEPPCFVADDADGDGVPNCGEDCDDGNPAVGSEGCGG